MFSRIYLERSGGVEHCIPTPLGIVAQIPYHPTAVMQKQALEQEIQSMLALGVIEESTSPWCSPPILVLKPDWSIHFCIDL